MKFTYTIDQLRDTPECTTALFMDYDWAREHGSIVPENYFTADSGEVEADTLLDACEKLYRIYNISRPIGYTGRSMSVSDIVNLWDTEQAQPVKTSWFCNRMGFVPIESNEKMLLKAEWIAHKNEYRLFRPDSPTDAVAYVDDLRDIDKEKYDLSLCDSAFEKTISMFSNFQMDGAFPCPRCGRHRMASNPIRNALSRYANVQICDDCGTDEAIRDLCKCAVKFSDWSISKNPDLFIWKDANSL